MRRAAALIAAGGLAVVSACGGGGGGLRTERSAGTTTSLATTTTVASTTASPTTQARRPPATATRATSTTAPRPRVLVFSRTLAFRHDSIPAGVAAVRTVAGAQGVDVDATEDQSVFTVANLARYRAVVFLSTTGDVLDPPGESALEQYVRGGGGFVGVHAAADTEYGWPFYGELLGTRFKQHPAVQPATLVVEDRTHASTAGLPARWTRTDEWYDFQTDPRGAVHVLLTIDESTYSGGTMGADHPIAWCHSVGAGRSWYSGLGHTSETFAEPLYQAHLAGGLRYAIGADARCG